MTAIKALRLALGLTQAELAHQLGVAIQTVNRWETGKYQPDPRSRRALERLAKKAQKEAAQ